MDTNEVWERGDWPRDTFFAWFDRLLAESKFRNEYALARAAEISHSAISNWRAGRQRPSTASLRKLARQLKVSEQEMLQRAGDMNATIEHRDIKPGSDLVFNDGHEPTAEERRAIALIRSSKLSPSLQERLIAEHLEEAQRARDELDRQLRSKINWAEQLEPS